MKDCYIDFKNANEIYSHGYGCGAFVYLRRVFEKLIMGTYQEHSDKLIPRDQFIRLEMDEKIKLITEYLPEYLVQNRTNIYGVLSKGVHELSDQDCIDYYPFLEQCIKIILDSELEKKQRLRNEREAASELRSC